MDLSGAGEREAEAALVASRWRVRGALAKLMGT